MANDELKRYDYSVLTGEIKEHPTGSIVMAADHDRIVAGLQKQVAQLMAFKKAFEDGYAYQAIKAERDQMAERCRELDGLLDKATAHLRAGVIERDALRAEVEDLQKDAEPNRIAYRGLIHRLRRDVDGEEFGVSRLQRSFLLAYGSASTLFEAMTERGDVLKVEGKDWCRQFVIDAAMEASR